MIDKETEDGAELIEDEAPQEKQHGLFGSSGIQLNEEELSSPATTKFLRHINTQHEVEISKLKSFVEQFFEKRQECEVLKKEAEALQKELNAKKDIENIQKVMITIGSLLLGAMKYISDSAPGFVNILIGLLAVILIIGGMFPVLRIGGSK